MPAWLMRLLRPRPRNVHVTPPPVPVISEAELERRARQERIERERRQRIFEAKQREIDATIAMLAGQAAVERQTHDHPLARPQDRRHR